VRCICVDWMRLVHLRIMYFLLGVSLSIFLKGIVKLYILQKQKWSWKFPLVLHNTNVRHVTTMTRSVAPRPPLSLHCLHHSFVNIGARCSRAVPWRPRPLIILWLIDMSWLNNGYYDYYNEYCVGEIQFFQKDFFSSFCNMSCKGSNIFHFFDSFLSCSQGSQQLTVDCSYALWFCYVQPLGDLCPGWRPGNHAHPAPPTCHTHPRCGELERATCAPRLHPIRLFKVYLGESLYCWSAGVVVWCVHRHSTPLHRVMNIPLKLLC